MQEEVLVPDEAVALAELEREPDRPVQEPAEARVEDALHHDVDGFSGPGEAGLEGHEARLHEEHEECGHEHPDRVDRRHEVVRLVGDLLQRCRPGRVVEQGAEQLHPAEHER